MSLIYSFQTIMLFYFVINSFLFNILKYIIKKNFIIYIKMEPKMKIKEYTGGIQEYNYN